MFKQVLGWTAPKIRDPAAADRWTWLILAVHAQLRLARPLAADLRHPWERPAPPGRLTPARVRRGFRRLRAETRQTRPRAATRLHQPPPSHSPPCGQTPEQHHGHNQPPGSQGLNAKLRGRAPSAPGRPPGGGRDQPGSAVQNLAYSGGYLDRAGYRRSDPDWAAALLDSPRTRLIPVWRDHCLVSGDPPAPVTVLDASRSRPVRGLGTPLFLGMDGDAGLFAVDLSGLDEAQAVEATGAERVGDLRAFTGTLGSAEAAALAYARGLAYWNRSQRFCGACGTATLSRHAGHLRVCGNEACA